MARRKTPAALADAEAAGKVITDPTPAQVRANPGARGYDENGHTVPADARAAYLVVPPSAADDKATIDGGA